MSAKILDGKALAKTTEEELSVRVAKLKEKTGINVMIAQDAVSCVALGTGKALDNLDVLDGKKK